MQFFDRLGNQVEQMWRERGYGQESFSEVALQALQALPPSEHVTTEEVVDWVLGASSIPFQHDLSEDFGQPPLTVYWGSDFRIEVLFWVVGLPGIHQHAFSGAFHVLDGSSLHTVCEFDLHNALGPRLLIGNVNLKKAEVLKAGASLPIVSGKEFIHSTFHLDRPSVSVVIRTNRDQDQLPQYVYLPPSIAYDPYETPFATVRRAQILRMLAACERFEALGRNFARLCESQDPFAIFYSMLQVYPLLGPQNRERLISIATRSHHELGTALRPTLAFVEHRDQILKFRRRTTSRELQFFLAVLLVVHGRESVLDLVREAFPDQDPSELILKWLQSLFNNPAVGSEFSEDVLLVLRWQLESLPAEEIRSRWRLKRTDRGHIEADSDLSRLEAAMQKHWLLEPLLAGSERLVAQ